MMQKQSPWILKAIIARLPSLNSIINKGEKIVLTSSKRIYSREKPLWDFRFFCCLVIQILYGAILTTNKRFIRRFRLFSFWEKQFFDLFFCLFARFWRYCFLIILLPSYKTGIRFYSILEMNASAMLIDVFF